MATTRAVVDGEQDYRSPAAPIMLVRARMASDPSQGWGLRGAARGFRRMRALEALEAMLAGTA